jgi:uncharacterized repeat protein (TIGR01451 family)
MNDPLPTLGNLNNWIITSNPGGCTIVSNTLNCQFGSLVAGATRTVIVATNAPGGANITACPGGQKLNNTATLTGTGQPTLTDTGDYICTPPGGYTLVKSPKNATYNIGDNINFTMVVTSTGPGTALNVVLNDPLPTLGNLNHWTLTTNPGGACTINAANVLNCPFGNLASGQTRTVVVATDAVGGANATACPGNQKLNNTATLTGTGLPTLTDTGDYLCTPGSYTLVKSPKNATYTIGQNINFTMVVTSTGPGVAANVVLNDPLPTLGNLNHWTLTTNPGGACTISVANVLNCPFGNLASGQTRTVVVATDAVGGANASACPGGQKLNNTATLTGTGLPTLTDTGDWICTPPQLQVVKTPDNGTFDQGGQVSFTIVVSNPAPAGASPATNVQVSDVLPNAGGLVFVTANTTQGTCVNPIVNNTLSCSLGTIQPGGLVTVTVLSAATTPPSACQLQSNPAATATADGGLTAQDSGSITCVPQFCPTPGTGQPSTCANPRLAASGSTGQCTVFETDAGHVDMTGPAGGIQGNVCIGANGQLTMSGSQFVNGSLLLGPGATFSNSGSTTVGSIINNADLTSEIAAVTAASNAAAALCTSFTDNIMNGQTITGHAGVNVLCVQNIILNGGTVTLTGPAGASFVINVAGTYTMDGGADIVAGAPLQPKDILINMVGTGSDVHFTGGGGGTNCCNAVLEGTLIALQRQIALSPGLVRGQIISGMNISIVSGASVQCPCPVGTVSPATHTLTVASTNPASGVPITVGPNDVNGQGNGSTQFTRTYNDGTTVTLTAPLTAGGNSFSSWTGCDSVLGNICTVSISANRTVTANYSTGTVTRTLTVASSNPNSGVSITVSPNDNNGQSNGSTQFTRIYNNNASVSLTAPLTAGGNNFSSWSGCDLTSGLSGSVCTVAMNADRTVTANYTPATGGNPTITLNFDGLVRDRVGQCDSCVTGDGLLDGTFTVTLGAASGNRTVTSLNLTRTGPIGVWDTIPNGFWALGAASGLDTALFNAANATVNFPLTAGSSFKAFAADFVNASFPNGLFTSGSIFTLTANFSDGSTASASVTIGGGSLTSVLTVASSNPSSGVTIGVSPNDNNGQGAGTTQFTRTYNNNMTVTLTAPATSGSNTFVNWTGCDSAITTTCNVTLTGNMTVTANYTTSSGGPSISLSFDGKVRDRVGQGEAPSFIAPDGQLDGTFTVTLLPSSGNRTVTSINLSRTGPIGIWDTVPGDGFWVLGVAGGLDTALLNGSDGSVNFPLTAGASFKIFAADFINGTFPNGLFIGGSNFMVTVNFSDGSTATANVGL